PWTFIDPGVLFIVGLAACLFLIVLPFVLSWGGEGKLYMETLEFISPERAEAIYAEYLPAARQKVVEELLKFYALKSIPPIRRRELLSVGFWSYEIQGRTSSLAVWNYPKPYAMSQLGSNAFKLIDQAERDYAASLGDQ